MLSSKHPETKRPDTLLSAVVTALTPTLLIVVALIVAMAFPRHATIVILSGAAVAAAVYYLLSRSRTSRGVRVRPSPGSATPLAGTQRARGRTVGR
jgi:hypothetical protein